MPHKTAVKITHTHTHKKKMDNFINNQLEYFIFSLVLKKIKKYNHHTSLVRWSLHKYKCLWSVGGKGRDSSLQERASHT